MQGLSQQDLGKSVPMHVVPVSVVGRPAMPGKSQMYDSSISAQYSCVHGCWGKSGMFAATSTSFLANLAKLLCVSAIRHDWHEV